VLVYSKSDVKRKKRTGTLITKM